jgi:hypothetical protein
MHILIRLIILFIFIFSLLMLNIPNINPTNRIMMKLYIFMGIFIFEFVVRIIITIFHRCLIDIRKIIKNSLQIALIAVVAYSIYNDLVSLSKPLIMKHNDTNIQIFIITSMVVIFIAIGYFLETILTNISPGVNDCLNTIYRQGSKSI